MLEVLILVAWTRSLAGAAASKGRSRWWGGVLPALWMGGEVAGLLFGMALGLQTLTLYAFMLLGATVAGLAAYLFVSLLPPAPLRYIDDEGVENRFHDPSNPYSPPARDPNRRDVAQSATLAPPFLVDPSQRSGRRRGRRRTTAGSTQ